MKLYRIAHVCLSCFYADNFGYQENILPKKHHQQGHKVEIITSVSGFNAQREAMYRQVGRYINENNIPVVVLPYKKIVGGLAEMLHWVDGLYEELNLFKPDVIFCHGLSFLSMFELLRYCRQNACKLYFDNHSDYYNTPTCGFKYRILNGLFWPMIARFGEKYCVKAWGTTPARCDYLKTVYGFSEEKVDLLVMGGDEDYIHYKKRDVYRKKICMTHGIATNTFLMCTGGKIDKGKKIIEVIDAVSKSEKNIKLLVFGSVMDEVKGEFEVHLKQSANTCYLGWLNQQDIYNLFVACDLAIFPGTHSVLWEQAVASGIPAIFKRRFMMEHVDVGGNCIFIEDDSASGILDAINKIVDDNVLYEDMKKIAIERGMKLFAYSNIAMKAIDNFV